jgi:RNA:NAD 2'-phosphotransferase (TPT1/KptA family)
MTHDLVESSKFPSYVLRYEPQSIGLVLDREGRVPLPIGQTQRKSFL